MLKKIGNLLFQRHLTTGSRARFNCRTTGIRYPTSYHVVCCNRMISKINDGYNNPSCIYIPNGEQGDLKHPPLSKHILEDTATRKRWGMWCLFQGVYPKRFSNFQIYDIFFFSFSSNFKQMFSLGCIVAVGEFNWFLCDVFYRRYGWSDALRRRFNFAET